MPNIDELHQIDLRSGQITKPCWSPNGKLLAVPTESGSIAIFDLAGKQIVETVGRHSAEVTSVGWNRESEFIMTGSLDRSIGVWEVDGGRRTTVIIAGHKEPLHSVEWTDEGAYAMTCSVDRVRALDGFCLEAGWTAAMENAVNTHGGFAAASCSYRTTLLLALAGNNGTVLVLTNLLTADVVGRVAVHQNIRCLAWSPADELLSVAAGQSIFTFHATQDGFKGSARELTKNVPGVDTLAFSADGRLLVSRDTRGLKVWEVKGGRLIAELEEPGRQRSSGIAIHPSKPLFATAAPNGTTLRILDLSSL